MLQRKIGRLSLFFITVNAILGTGIFFLPAIGARYAGSASLFSWAIMGVIALLMSLVFAELVSLYPKAGGVFQYTKMAFGEFPAFTVGWISWIVANITISMLVVGSLLYLIPDASIGIHLGLSLVFILFFNFVSYRGISFSSKMLAAFGFLTLLAVVVLAIPGAFTFSTANFADIFSFPTMSVLLAVYFISETFFGWETAAYLSEEIKNARRVLPRMMVVTTAVITGVSLLLVFLSIGGVGADVLGSYDSINFLLPFYYGSAGPILAFFVFLPLIGTAASWIVSSPRLLYAMARDKVLIHRFTELHSVYKTPHQAIAFQTGVSMILTIIAFGNYFTLLSLLVPLVMIMYSIAFLSMVKLRFSKPHAQRSFIVPFGKVLPIALVAVSAVFLVVWVVSVSSAVSLFLLGLILAFLGLPLYILIKLQVDSSFVASFFDRISWLWDLLVPLWYDRDERTGVVRRLNVPRNANVLDFGCGTGLTTAVLSRHLTHGRVVGVDISKKQIERALKRTRREHPNVMLIKGSHNVLPLGPFDGLTAVGVLEYFEDPSVVIKQLFRSLKKNGRFSFLIFGNSFGLVSPAFLKNKQSIHDLFRRVNAEYRVKKKIKGYTDFWYVWGRKA